MVNLLNGFITKNGNGDIYNKKFIKVTSKLHKHHLALASLRKFFFFLSGFSFTDTDN